MKRTSHLLIPETDIELMVPYRINSSFLSSLTVYDSKECFLQGSRGIDNSIYDSCPEHMFMFLEKPELSKDGMFWLAKVIKTKQLCCGWIKIRNDWNNMFPLFKVT